MSKFNLLLTFIFLLVSGIIRGQNQNLIDSLVKELRNVHETTRVDYFNQLSQLYWQRSFDTSLLYARLALNLVEKLDDDTRLANSYNMLGNAYYLLGDFTKSLDFHMKALRIKEALKDSNAIAKSLNNIGVVHLNLNNQSEALEYFNKATIIYKGLDQDETVAALTNNIGAVYFKLGEYKKAYEHFLEHYQLLQTLGDDRQLATALNNLGEVTNKMNLPDQALDYYTQALTKSKEIYDKDMLAMVYANIGDLYLKQGRYSDALNHLNEALKYANEVNSYRAKHDIYLKLSQLYDKQSNYKLALMYYKLYSEAKDSMFSETKKLKISELEMQYKAENFQNENELLKKEKEIDQLHLARQKYIIFSLAAISILILVILFISYKRTLLKKKSNKLLEEKNNELEIANQKLRDSEKHLSELNATKDKFFSIIGHDLRNPLNALLGFSELISGNSREYTIDEIQRYNKIINDSAKSIHQLIENLLEWSRSQAGNIDFTPKKIDLFILMQEIISVLEIHANKKEIIIESGIAENTLVFCDRNLLSAVLRNLINNAIKFTPQGGKININARTNREFMIVSVTDTGIGMTQEQINKLFTLDTSNLVTGTSEEKGTGLGLILCKEFIDMHGGKIWVESEPEKGSTFAFSLPIYKM